MSSVQGESWQVPGCLQGCVDIGSASARRLARPGKWPALLPACICSILAEMFLVCASVGRRLSPLEVALALTLFELSPQQLHAVAGAHPGQHE
jgi:hypothetical protein